MSKATETETKATAKGNARATKRSAPRKGIAKPTPSKDVTPEERWNMIAEAAYYIAEKRGFIGGDPAQDWSVAERQIDTMLGRETPKRTKAAQPMELIKALANLDPETLMAQLNKAFEAYEQAGIEVDAVVGSQRKNVEALAKANRQAIDGLREVLVRQIEILGRTLEELTNQASELAAAGGARELVVKQTELLRAAFGRAVTSMRELTELAAKSNTTAYNTVKQRITDSVAEIKELLVGLSK